MLKKIIVIGTVSGVLVMALLANPKPMVKPMPQAIETTASALSPVNETSTVKAKEEGISITESILLPLQAPTAKEMLQVTKESVAAERPTVSSQDSSKVTKPNISKITNKKPQAVELAKSSKIIATTNLKIGDKVLGEGFGHVEYGGPNSYSQSYSTGSFDIMIGNTGVPVGKPQMKELVEEYVPHAGDIQTDIRTGVTSVYIDGQGFVPVEREDNTDD